MTVAEIGAAEGRPAVDEFDVETVSATILFADGEEAARFRRKVLFGLRF